MIGLALALALSQPLPPPSNDEITVIGRKAVEAATIQKFVDSISVPTGPQIARFHIAVCPVALGLPDEAAHVIEERIRETARGVGAQVARKRPCEANLLFIAVEDGSAFLMELRRARRDWLDGVSDFEIRAMIASPRPVRAWAITSLRNEDGLREGTSAASASGSHFQSQRTLRVMSASILKLPTRVDVEGAIVLIDRSALTGLSLAQVADYVAMRGLARTREPSSDQVDSILALFSPGDGPRPQALSGADIVYLQSLYRSGGTASAAVEKGRMARDIKRDIR